MGSDTFLQAAIILVGLAVATYGGGPVMKLILRACPPPPELGDALKGSYMIGYLERFLIFVMVITDNVSAVGFLITAKSIFRFGEITKPEHRQIAEYVLLGTLASFSYGMAVSFVARCLLRMVSPDC